MRSTVTALMFFVVAIFLLPSSSHAQADDGLILTESGYSVDETVTRLVSTLEDRGLTVMGTIDHAGNAATVDQELRPTQVIVFGNPNLGTPLMQNSRSVAIDLPQKFLVWEDSSGRTFVTYNGVPYLVDRHGLTGPEEVLATVTGALANFAGSVAPAPAEPTAAPTEEPPVEETAVVETPVATPDQMPVTGSGSSNPLTLGITAILLLIGLLFLAPGLRRNLTRGKIAGTLLLVVMGGTIGNAMLSDTPLVRPAQADNHTGLISNASPYSVDETVERLQAAIEARGLNIMMTIDHAANAAGVDRELLPTQLILFGNPNIGTSLMQSNQTIGIDLPQKMLVWEDEEGNVQVVYNDPVYLGERHNISGKDEVLNNVAGALAGIVTEATAAE